jgi:hypothetical protein
MKEVRQLAWPWMFVTLAGVLSLIRLPRMGFLSTAHLPEIIIAAGAFLGIPLLATLPIGAEFQHRTFGLQLAQPIPRGELWRLKMMVTAAAVLLPVILYSRSFHWESGASFWIGAAIITAVSAGGPYWTLVARSIIGGLGLSACAVGAGEVVWFWLADRFGILESHRSLPASWIWGTVIASLIYSVVFLWLGRRKLLQFQASEGMQAGEAVIPGAQLVPGFFVDWFRPRATGPIVNLLRREFHLLRGVWALALVVVVDWIFIAAFHFMDTKTPPPSPLKEIQIFAIAIAAACCGLIAVLAGVLSLGEEKNWGTHEWQMTVPISASVQWAVKLLFALFTSILAAAGPPLAVMVIRGWLHGSAFEYVPREMLLIVPAELSLLTLVAFWCACFAKGTMRAVLWVFPVFFMMGLAGMFGDWLLNLMGRQAVQGIQSLIWRFDPIAVSGAVRQLFEPRNLPILVLLAISPCIAVAIVQSYRLFRGQADESRKQIILTLLPLALTAVFCGALISASVTFVFQTWEQTGTLAREMHVAIETLQPGAGGPVRRMDLSADDLAKAAPISDRTRQWLAGSTIAVAPTFPELHVPLPAGGDSRTFSFYALAVPGKEGISYAAVIHRPSGSTCYVNFSTSAHARFGYMNGTCE